METKEHGLRAKEGKGENGPHWFADRQKTDVGQLVSYLFTLLLSLALVSRVKWPDGATPSK